MRTATMMLVAVLLAPMLCAELTDEQLDKVLSIWREYDMPLPPEDATLAILPSDSRTIIEGGRQVPQPQYAIVWRLPGDADPPRYLAGLWIIDEARGKEQDIALLESAPVRALALGRLTDYRRFFDVNQAFACGLQLGPGATRMLPGVSSPNR